ncbi:MAG TPA: hypothetical protein VLX91_13260 [Candidatus Acidoferrales bacterium]|nr:hypothetical protein [Candidatus Acidoferrales bacterium]
MVQVKGSAVSDAVKAVKNNFGEQAYNTILGMLKDETRAIFEKGSIMQVSWYSLDAFVEFLEMDLKVTAHGDEKELIKRSEAVIERELSGIYKLFVRLGSPGFVLNRIMTVHQTYFQGVNVEVSEQTAGRAVLRYTGFEKRHRIIGYSIIGFFRKALEISGAQDVRAEFTTAIEEGKGFCELVLWWSGK